MEFAEKFFKVRERGSTLGTEVRAGISTFLTMSYILLVNPTILSRAGLPLDSVLTSTAVSSIIASLGIGFFANMPVGVAPGMGLNAFLVYSQVLGTGVSVENALACCLTAACLVAVLAVIRALSLILYVVPNTLKLATVVGMGLLLSLIGLQQAKVVVANESTMVGLGDVFELEPVITIGGLALIAGLHYRKVKGSILIGILLSAGAFWMIRDAWPTRIFSLPVMRFIALDFSDILALKGNALNAIAAYSLVMIFDIGGAMYGLGKLANLVAADHSIPGAVAAYLSAAAGSIIGAYTGTTPLIIAAESAVGIKEGGRTGLVAVTVACLFTTSLFLAPIFQDVPSVATAPVLILVGTMMMGESIHIDWTTIPVAVPAFLTIVVQPFTFSIANGIYAGMLMTILIALLTGEFIPAIRSLCSSESSDAEAADTSGFDEPLLFPTGRNRSQGTSGTPLARGFKNAAHMVARVAHDAQDDPSRFERKSQVVLVTYAGEGSPVHGSSPMHGGHPANVQEGGAL